MGECAVELRVLPREFHTRVLKKSISPPYYYHDHVGHTQEKL